MQADPVHSRRNSQIVVYVDLHDIALVCIKSSDWRLPVADKYWSPVSTIFASFVNRYAYSPE